MSKVSTKEFGSYLEFEVPDRRFVIYETPKGIVTVVIISAIGVLLACGVIIFLILKRKKKKK